MLENSDTYFQWFFNPNNLLAISATFHLLSEQNVKICVPKCVLTLSISFLLCLVPYQGIFTMSEEMMIKHHFMIS